MEHLLATTASAAGDPWEPIRSWWYLGTRLPKRNSDEVRRMVADLGARGRDPDVMYWAAVAQSQNLFGSNRPQLELVKAAAEQGYPAAMSRLGLAMVNGDGVPPDRVRGLQMLEDAMAKGESTAGLELGRVYLKGLGGVPVDLDRAEKCFRFALEKGHIRAHYLLSDVCHLRGDEDKAFAELIAGAEAGDEQAMRLLGEEYQRGTRVLKPDPAQAVHWYKAAAERGLPAAERALAEAIWTGYGGLRPTEKNWETARQLLDRAVRSQDVEAMRLQARLYLTGEMGADLDFPKAVAFLERAVALKDARACYDLAILYVEGFVVPRDVKRATELMERSAELGCPDAKPYLKRMKAPPPTTMPSSRGIDRDAFSATAIA